MQGKPGDLSNSPGPLSVAECNHLSDARTKDVYEMVTVFVGQTRLCEIVDEKQCFGASEPFVRRETCGAI